MRLTGCLALVFAIGVGFPANAQCQLIASGAVLDREPRASAPSSDDRSTSDSLEVFIQEHLRTMPVLNRVPLDGRIAGRSAALIGSVLAGYGIGRGHAEGAAVRAGVTLAHWGLRKSTAGGFEVLPEVRRGGFALLVTRRIGSRSVQ